MSQLLVFVRYVQKAGTKLDLKEEFLFCESLQTTAPTTDVMNLIKAFFEKHYIALEKIGFACTDRALAMLGCKSGFVALLKEMNLNLVIIHCILHRYALMSKTLPNNLKEVMDSQFILQILLERETQITGCSSTYTKRWELSILFYFFILMYDG